MAGQYDELWADLDRRLRSVVSDLGTSLSTQDAAAVEDFLDHNEFGVAFELLRDRLIETETPIPAPTVDALAEIARLMDLDSQESTLRSFSAKPS